MIPPYIEELIIKYINGSTASVDELEILGQWIKDPAHEQVFLNYLKINYAMDHNMNRYDVNHTKKKLLRKIRQDKSLLYRHRIRSVLKYAAIAVFFLAAGLFFRTEYFAREEQLVIEEESVILQLENGETRAIRESEVSKVTGADGKILGEQEGNRIAYTGKENTNKLSYNKLVVPHGKTFEVLLSDGTYVHLNAGSSLKYPVRFVENESREVFLNGEAYFDVAKDKEHPFKVKAEGLFVKVTGTEFNVTAYPEDRASEVVLVNGSVLLSSAEGEEKGDEKIPLSPGFKGTLDKDAGNISTERVNTSIYTSWINGDIVFRNAPFGNIIKKLERYYNVTIINNNHELTKEPFNASFNVQKETIEEVLYYFNKVNHIEYNIVNNKIIIN
ncbi:FecR family protein [Sinomicrobium sp. M5D2P17]